MKIKGLYEIHALIGRCHLHNKKKLMYSISLKIGTKAIANTEYKMPINDQINYNTELILKIDKTLFESGGKLSLIVAMLTEEKEKKIIGSVLANYKQKGLQALRLAQCSCKDKCFQVNVQFEVVNLQVHNNNLRNNKFESPNNSEMKDLKKALTISREKELVKSSRTKLSTGIKSPVQKTESKLNKQKIQSRLKEELSPDLSSLTTKISPHAPKSAQESKLIADLRNRILEIESDLNESLNKHKAARNQVNTLQSEVDMLRKENEILLQILTFQEQKSSAAIEYITYLTQKISQNNLFDNHFYPFFDLIQTIKNANTPTTKDIKSTQHKKQIKAEQSFYKVQPIEENIQHINQNTQKLIEQVEEYKAIIAEFKKKIIDLETDESEKTNVIVRFQKLIRQFEQQNLILSAKNEQLQKSIKDYDAKLNTLKIEFTKLQSQDKALEKRLSQTMVSNQKAKQELKDMTLKYQLIIKDKRQFQQAILKLQQKIQVLQESKAKLQQSQQQLRKVHGQRPMSPTQSQIIMKKTGFYDGDQIDNIVNEINTQSSPNQHDDDLSPASLNQHDDDLFPTRDLLVSSRIKYHEDKEPFLFRNKSESLLKDLQQIDPQQPGIDQTAHIQNNQKDLNIKCVKKIAIPQHKKLVQKYNYDYDIDSLNYFNNFEENHQRMEMSADHQNNSSEIENDPSSKP